MRKLFCDCCEEEIGTTATLQSGYNYILADCDIGMDICIPCESDLRSRVEGAIRRWKDERLITA